MQYYFVCSWGIQENRTRIRTKSDRRTKTTCVNNVNKYAEKKMSVCRQSGASRPNRKSLRISTVKIQYVRERVPCCTAQSLSRSLSTAELRVSAHPVLWRDAYRLVFAFRNAQGYLWYRRVFSFSLRCDPTSCVTHYVRGAYRPCWTVTIYISKVSI